MTVKEFYELTGGDYQGTLSRLLTEDRMRRFALKFENDPSYSDLCSAVAAGNVQEAFRAAHTLKGVCQNLGFDRLYKCSSAVTEILRAGSLDVKEGMAETESCYNMIIDAIRALKESN